MGVDLLKVCTSWAYPWERWRPRRWRRSRRGGRGAAPAPVPTSCTLSANIRQVILSLQLQIINRHPPPRDLAFSLKSYSEYFIQAINNWTIKCFVNVYVRLLQHYWLDNITADCAHIHFGAVSRCTEEKHQLQSGSFGYINIEHDTAPAWRHKLSSSHITHHSSFVTL